MNTKLIHTLKSKAGMTDQEYRTLLRQRFDTDSCKNLSEEDGRLLASILRGKAHDAEGQRPITSMNISRASGKIWYLFYQLQDITGQTRQASYLTGIIRKTLGEAVIPQICDGPRLDLDRLDAGNAQKVIEALKQRIKYELEKSVPF